MPEENTPEGTGKRIGKEILSFVLYFVIVIAAMLLIIHYVGQRTEVSGSSIIIFPYKYEEDTYYIKRIIGLPGEHVRIDDSGNIYINEKVLKESYGREVIQDPGIARDEITLGEGEYFVLGDNRNNSSDSRDPSVGIIQKKDIIGRAWLQIYPFDEFGFIRHQ